ncbi:MAG: hypothetical protein K0S07_1467 [Chlamydiales bacterium]|nr:hypothetical protein [Chlamydiales bacterium]
MDSFIEKEARTVVKRWVMIHLSVCCLSLYFFQPKGVDAFYSWQNGPQSIQPEELYLNHELYQNRLRLIDIECGELYEVGKETSSTKSGPGIIKRYYLTSYAGAFVLVKRLDSRNSQISHLEGFVESIPSRVQRNVIKPLLKNDPGLEPLILPFMIDATDNAILYYLSYAILFVIGCFSFMGFLRQIFILGNVASRYPGIKALRAYGDPDRIINHIDTMYHKGSVTEYGDVLFIDGWAIHKTWFNVRLISLIDVILLRRIEDLFQRISSHRFNYTLATIKTGKGPTYRVLGSSSYIEDVLEKIAYLAPWARFD